MSEKVLCPTCDNEFVRIAQHWNHGDNCNPTPMSEYQMELLTGILMGDGSMVDEDKNSRLQVSMITKPFLEWLDRELGIYSTGVRQKITAAESAEQNRNSGFSPNAKAENYHDVYKLTTRTLSQLNELAGWYKTGNKVFPSALTLTPTILKMWYVCDGTLEQREDCKNIIKIGCKHEIEHEQYFKRLFEDIGFDCRFHYSQYIAFSNADTKDLLKYMGNPPPGFEYKWKTD